MYEIGFIGGGKMAGALISAVIRAGLVDNQAIVCSDVLAEQRTRLSEQFGIQVTVDNRAVLADSQLVVLAFKPQNFPDAVADLADVVRADQLIVSIMAGVRIAAIQRHLPGKVVRVMPNTACLVGEMAAGFAVADDVSAEQIAQVSRLLRAAGTAVQVSEEQLDAVTGLSGSGPAFVAHLIDSFIAAGVAASLTPDIARELTLKTFSGTARLLSQWDMPAQELTDLVSSPGGTTIAGREVLEASDVSAVIQQTVLRAAERSRELGQ